MARNIIFDSRAATSCNVARKYEHESKFSSFLYTTLVQHQMNFSEKGKKKRKRFRISQWCD